MKFEATVSGPGYGYVYVMSYPGSTKFKVGHSLNPTSRASDIGGTLAPEIPKMAYCFWCSERREDVERRAHALLKEYRGNGEWFNAPIETIHRAIKDAAKNEAIEIKEVFSDNSTYSFTTKEQRQKWLLERKKEKKVFFR
jgi:hypothetical protein